MNVEQMVEQGKGALEAGDADKAAGFLALACIKEAALGHKAEANPYISALAGGLAVGEALVNASKRSPSELKSLKDKQNECLEVLRLMTQKKVDSRFK